MNFFAIFGLVPNWVWAALAATLAATSCKLTVDLGAVKLELEKTRVVYEQERAHQATVLAQAQQRARQAEQTLTESTVTIREETHAQVLASAAAADDLRRRLRVAAANAATAALLPRATAVATYQPPGPVQAGAVLPAGAGDDLVSLALRADELRVELQACYRTYDAARAAIEAVSAPDLHQTPRKPAP